MLVDDLRHACADDWHAFTQHAFLAGIADGSLPEAAFREYLIQDYRFLVHFARAHAQAGADLALGGGLTQAMVRFAARHEYARTVEDVLARRARLLFLDARLAASLAPAVARLLQEETGVDPQQAAFERLAQQYAVLPD